MALVRPVTGTKISTVSFGQPVYDILKNADTPNWIECTPAAGFSQFGGGYKPLSFLQLGKLIFLQGMLRNAADLPSSLTTVATYPTTIAPQYRVLTMCVGGIASGGVPGLVRVNIELNGNIAVQQGQQPVIANQYLSFDTVWTVA